MPQDLIANLEALLTRGEDAPSLRFALASRYLAAGDPVAALRHAEAAVALDAGYSAGWKVLGQARTAAGDERGAIESYRRGIEVADARGDRRRGEPVLLGEHRVRRRRPEAIDADGEAALADPALAAALRGHECRGVRGPVARPERFGRRELPRERVPGRGRDDDLHVRVHLRPAGWRHVVPGGQSIGRPRAGSPGGAAHELARDEEPVRGEPLGHRVHRLEVLGAQDGDRGEVVVRKQVREQDRIGVPQAAARNQIVGKARRHALDLARARRIAPVDPDRGAGRHLSLQFKDDVLVGCNSIGWTEHVGVMRGLVEGQVKLGAWKDTLLQDPTKLMEAYLARAQAQDVHALA